LTKKYYTFRCSHI